MATTDLMTALKIASVTFIPTWVQEFSRQAGGAPRVADLGGGGIWTAKIATANMANDEIESAAALIDDMQGSLGTFYVWNPRKQYPRLDLAGTILGSSTVTIHTLGGDNKSIRLQGLPAGYVISRGDFFSWDQGSSPVRRCLHRFTADATADGSGILPLTGVAPHIRVGASTGLTVTLKRPAAEMMIQPGSYDFPSTGTLISTLTFTAIQVP